MGRGVLIKIVPRTGSKKNVLYRDSLPQMRSFICFEEKQIKIKFLIYKKLREFYLL